MKIDHIALLTVISTLMLEASCQTKDYYKILGIPSSSTVPEVKKAFRKLAVKYHPDKNREPDAEAKFREIAEAYEVLSNEDKKGQYDAGRRGGGGGGGFDFGRGTFAKNFDFNFDELFKQFEQDIRGGGDHAKAHYRAHFGSHLDARAKNAGSFFDMDDFFAGFDSHFDDSFGTMDSMFQRSKFMPGSARRRSQSCHTVTQKVGNTVTTYTQCS